MKTVVIVGVSGQFGQYMARLFLDEGWEVVGVSRTKPLSSCLLNNKKFSYVEADATREPTPVLRRDLVRAHLLLISVPIGYTLDTIANLAPYLQDGQAIADVTSVKVLPVDMMRRCSPPGVEVIGMHPMFSPTLNLRGKNVIFTPLIKDSPTAKELTALFSRRGAFVTFMTPEEHDYAVAIMQALCQFVFWVFGKTLEKLHWNNEEHSCHETTFYSMVRILLERMLSFSPELYTGIQLFNPQVPSVLNSFVEEASLLLNILQKKDEKTAENSFRSLKEWMMPHPDAVAISNEFYNLLQTLRAQNVND